MIQNRYFPDHSLPRRSLMFFLGLTLVWGNLTCGIHAWGQESGDFGKNSNVDSIPSKLSESKDAVSFGSDIRPILAKHCFKCHGPDEGTREAGLRLDRQDAAHADLGGYFAIDSKNPGDSEILRRVTSEDVDLVMPPPDTGKVLTEGEIRKLKAWIERGGEYESHWAFDRPKLSAVPEVADKDWCRDELDRFVLARMEQKGLEPDGEVDRRRFIRRLTLDLLGVTPDPDEVQRFVEDRHPAALKRLVDRLLASPEYGEKFATSWLDLARYSDTNGYEKDRPRSIWPYRSWVIDSLNQDLSYDQFSIEQLAGDMLPEATIDQKIATGFHRNTMLNEEGGIDPLEYRFHSLVDRVATTGTVWMGITVGCAQCHTHKFDPITHDEYYGLMAIFNQADEPDLMVESQQQKQKQLRLQTQIDHAVDQLIATHLLPQNQTLSADPKELSEVQLAFQTWVAQQIGLARSWKTLKLKNYDSTMPKLTSFEDGSILASGDVTKRDVYRLRFEVTPSMIGATSLKLEALPDASLPAGGPGMAYYEGRRGDFFLSECVIRLDGEPLSIANASHSYGKISVGSGNANATNVLDSDGSTGWSTSGREGQPSELVLQLAKPLASSGELEIEMLFERHFAAALGKFRFSVSSGPPASAVTTPVAWNSWLLDAETASLTEDQCNLLERHFVMETPLLAEQRKGVEKLISQVPESLRTLAMRERDEQDYRTTYRHHRGEYLQPRNVVEPGVPEFLDPEQGDQIRDRLSFAKWLVSDRNPLAARVAVNRAWREFFGVGILDTAGDFGTQSEQPSHPRLLDYLATRFVADGWSSKWLHRKLVLSSVYRQEIGVPPEVDPSNRLLSTFPRRRLRAEVLRDALLSAAGNLSTKMGGPSVYPPQPKSVMQLAWGNPSWDTSNGEDRFRRSLYTFRKRTSPFAAFVTFDGTSREICTARRDSSITPLQALTLLNDPMFLEIAEALQETVGRELGEQASDEQWVRELFQRLLIRQPNESEVELMLAFASELKQSKDRWLLVARAMMNLDEAITIP